MITGKTQVILDTSIRAEDDPNLQGSTGIPILQSV